LLGNPCGDIEDETPVFGTRSDVEKGELIGTLAVIYGSQLYRIPGIPETKKLDAFYHTPIFDIEAGNHPFCKHGKLYRLEVSHFMDAVRIV
jgi:hypothetical protein